METPTADALIKHPEFLCFNALAKSNLFAWTKLIVEAGVLPTLCLGESSEAQRLLKSFGAEVVAKMPEFGLRDVTAKKVRYREPFLDVVYAGRVCDLAGDLVPGEDDLPDVHPLAAQKAPDADVEETKPSAPMDMRLFYRLENAEHVNRTVLLHDQSVRRRIVELTELETRVSLSSTMLLLWHWVKANDKTRTLHEHWMPVTSEGIENAPQAVVSGFRLKAARLTGDIVKKVASHFEFDGKSKTAIYLAARHGPWPEKEWMELTRELCGYCKKAGIEYLMILR